jgi:sterol desaturase/sphingolipid hydroxylase (fatty acid hydroxylase superfamily)
MHHANVNPAPWSAWSGLSLHAAEHVLLGLGGCAAPLRWIVPSSPLHVIFHPQHLAFSPAQGHNGFDKVVVKDGRAFSVEYYTHYLHHKYFEVNYGDDLVPFDRLFGAFHDGSDSKQKKP